MIDPQLPNESTHYQIVQLTDDIVIEAAYEVGHKAGVLLVDLTVAYDSLASGSDTEASAGGP